MYMASARGISAVCALLLHTAAASCDDAIDFDTFIRRFNRSFSEGSEEYSSRLRLFENRRQAVAKHNCESGKLWRAAVNHLADRTDGELAALRGWSSNARPEGVSRRGPQPTQLLRLTPDELPREHNWTQLRTMRNILDQGQCGSCWAFAAVTTLRAHSEIAGVYKPFSVQQVVSCTPNKHHCGGDGGCQGATAELAMDYVWQTGCVDEDEFQYSADDSECRESMRPKSHSEALVQKTKAGVAFGMLGWRRLPENKLQPLMQALVFEGPVSVTIASAYSWNSYSSGILHDCPRDAAVDHAVVLIGYGEASVEERTDPVKYWLLQNSWGTSWGEGGYIRMLRHDDSEDYCGTDHEPELGSGCAGGPPEVEVCGMCGILYDTAIPHFAQDRHSDLAWKLARTEVVLSQQDAGVSSP